MLCFISGIEYTGYTRHKRIVELAFEEAIAMCVDEGNSLFRGNGNVIVADTDEGAVFSVSAVDGGVALTATGVVS